MLFFSLTLTLLDNFFFQKDLSPAISRLKASTDIIKARGEPNILSINLPSTESNQRSATRSSHFPSNERSNIY